MNNFTHLHVHTQYSILDGASNIKDLVKKAKNDGMTAIAITDHGNMFGVKKFHEAALAEGIKPILGIETYVARRTRFDKIEKIDRSGYHLIVLAKNKIGYHNLMKLSSLAYIDGLYYRPRVDRELLEKYNEGLIVCSACLGGEVPQHIMKGDMQAAEDAIRWHKKVYGDDFYLELQRHKTGNPKKDSEIYENQVKVNTAMLELAKKHNVKVIASNDVHFIYAADAEAHDRLICLNTGKDLDDPTRMQYTKQEFLKSPAEMSKLFADVPEAVTNTMEIADKVEEYKINSDPLMPDFGLPEGFTNEDDYLKHIAYEGMHARWGDNLTPQIQERIDFELETIKKMGFPGYFLIVWDFIKAAREMGVIVGPGRGSAAGSAVAYAIQITNIDPIKYDLLFERFLNPDRISMPDIDIDFDDDGRQQVLDWVVDKYGAKRVSHIVTFGTMASKMALKDIARVHKMPLSEVDRYAKLIPDDAKNLKEAFQAVPELKQAYNSNNDLVSSTFKFAEKLEGSVRQTGVHACGIIIGKEDLMNNIPVCTVKDVDLLITQYDGKFVESVGMLKMDFLGLKTLSIIKEALENIKRSKGITIDIDNVALDDPKTFELYSRGETTALFQFESPGMKKHLRALKPNRFEDLVAMNALYRPGPMQYIPSFIRRKHGEEKIVYDHPLMADFLADTYGITVYQEQVMLQSRALANFTRGQSDTLRKAMGKKQIKMMNELKVLFTAGCKANPEFMKPIGGDEAKAEKLTDKIWGDWEAFASYAFNKSHSVCYAYVSYQTAYVKAHYPAEFMAAVLSRNLSDIKKITIFMDETRRMGLTILGPDVNESYTKFTVNKQGALRFGMGAVKGVGDAAVLDIINERDERGDFKDIYDFVERVNLRTVNKKTIESLALAGGFDSMPGVTREQMFKEDTNGQSFIETLLKYGNSFRTDQSQNHNSLFGGMGGGSADIKKPMPEPAETWGKLERLNKEKDLVGIYISAHPLDDFRLELMQFSNKQLSDFEDMPAMDNQDVKVGGIVTAVEHKTTKTGKPFGSITLEDYSSSYKFSFFGKDYTTYRDFMYEGTSLYITGRVQKKSWGDTNELEYKINKIEYLSDLKDRIKSLSLKIPIEKLTTNIITEIKHMIETNKGNAELRFLIYEPDSKTWVQMHSNNYKVNITSEVLHFLEEHSDVMEYKLG